MTDSTYVVLNEEIKQQLTMERLAYLEQQHFRAQLVMDEAVAVGDEQTAVQQRSILADLQTRMQFVFDKMQTVAEESPPEDIVE